MTAEIASMIGRFRNLPRHIAKKHLAAAMRRAMKPGVPILRRNTPPIGTRRGRRKAGEKPQSSGGLRKSVTAKSKAVGGVVYGVVGYRHGWESRKAIWHEFGTKRGLKAKHMAANSMTQIRGPAAATLVREMAISLERAATDLGKAPGR